MTAVSLHTKRFFRCPHGCEHEWCVEHLFGQHASAGPWGCDVCGRTYLLEVRGEDVFVTEYKERRYYGRALLELPPQKESVFFTVKSLRFDEPTITDEGEEHRRYFYESHMCPTNWFRDVVEVTVGGKDDPHGIVRFVKAFDVEEKPR